jgi:hypothetical protein
LTSESPACSCFSEILIDRCDATVSASLAGIVDLGDRADDSGGSSCSASRSSRTAPARSATGPRVSIRPSSALPGTALRLRNTRRGRIARFPRAHAHAFDQHLDGAVGQLQQLQDVGDGADVVDRIGAGSSIAASFWAASRICLSFSITSSSARSTFRGRRTAARSCENNGKDHDVARSGMLHAPGQQRFGRHFPVSGAATDQPISTV